MFLITSSPFVWNAIIIKHGNGSQKSTPGKYFLRIFSIWFGEKPESFRRFGGISGKHGQNPPSPSNGNQATAPLKKIRLQLRLVSVLRQKVAKRMGAAIYFLKRETDSVLAISWDGR